jgi:hypothetical protein
MRTKLTRIIFTLIAVLSVTACESLEKLDNTFLKRDPQVLIDDGATRLSAARARDHVSGNTEFWHEGSVYYHPDGKLTLVWLKIKSAGSWEISADGSVCLTAPSWENCHYYLELEDAVTTVDGDKTNGVLKIEPGDKSLR